MSASQAESPNVAAVLATILQRVPREQQPLLIALAERLAAVRYRRWADEMAKEPHRTNLLACADREEEIARRVEALYPGAAELQQALRATAPELDDVNRSLFTGRSLAQQFAIQAEGERLGAATWRAFAQRAPTAEARASLLSCAELEEASAALLESLLQRGVVA